MPYTYSRTVTIDKIKVPNTDQTNFPVLFSGTYAYLATVANGGKVTNANGYDIIFTSDYAGATKLDHEIETYTATTGAVNFWVRVPTVTTASNTVIYLWYGNSSVTTSQENKTGVWDANYKMVQHLKESSNPYNDSTSNANNSTTGTYPTASSSGQIDGAQSFNGSTNFIGIPDNNSLDLAGEWTLELWVKNNSLTTSAPRPLDKISDSGGYGIQYIVVSPHNYYRLLANNNVVMPDTTPADPTSNWQYLTFTYSVSASKAQAYMDGIARGSQTTSIASLAGNANRLILGAYGDAIEQFFNGLIDEVRISNTARSADWITTSYNSQNSPSTFYTLGAETTNN